MLETENWTLYTTVHNRKHYAQPYFMGLKDVRLNYIHFCTMERPNKKEFEDISWNYLPDINFKYFIKIYKKMYCWTIVNDVTLSSDNLLKFRKKYFEYIINSWQLIIRLEMKKISKISASS